MIIQTLKDPHKSPSYAHRLFLLIFLKKQKRKCGKRKFGYSFMKGNKKNNIKKNIKSIKIK